VPRWSVAEHPGLQPADERTALDERIEQYRSIVVELLSGLDDDAAARQPLPATALSAGGIVKHLAAMEDHWFQARLLGLPLPEPWRSAPLAEDPDWPFTSARHDSVAEIVALYDRACDRSRAAARSRALDDVAVRPSFGVGPVNLRWILVHVIDETARHTGHLDLLRDALDRR